MKKQSTAHHEALAPDSIINNTIDALKANGIEAEVVDSGVKARERVLAIIPHTAEVMTMTSRTLEEIGLTEHINSPKTPQTSVKTELSKLDRKKDHLEMQRRGAAPEWAIGSVHAVTEDGKVLIASNTGSQLPGYAYGSPHVIWIVSTKKIVKDMHEALDRIYSHVLPLESERARKAYGLPEGHKSNVSKLLIVNKEVTQGRIRLIFVKENFGF